MTKSRHRVDQLHRGQWGGGVGFFSTRTKRGISREEGPALGKTEMGGRGRLPTQEKGGVRGRDTKGLDNSRFSREEENVWKRARRRRFSP